MRKSIALLLVLTVSTIASAGSVNTPNTFVAGTKAKASEVNANFSAVETAINNNDSRITSNATAAGSNSSNIANNTSDIAINSSNITTNTSNIATNGTGIADLANRSWGKSGNDLFYSDGNVGIGTTIPNAKLHIVAPRISGTDYGLLMSSSDNGGFSVADMNYVNETTGTWWHTTLRPSSGGGNLEWHGRTNFDPTSPAVIPLSLTLNGNVGIGTTTPKGSLDIQQDNADFFLNSGFSGSIINMHPKTLTGNGYSMIRMFTDIVSPVQWAISAGSGGVSPNSNFRIIEEVVPETNSVDRLVIVPGGNVGIGTKTPNSTLQVGGYIQLATTGGITPPVSDCDQSTEYGRMKVDEVNSFLYICTISGWVTK